MFDDETTLRASSSFTVNPYREIWLGLFRNKVSVPIDEFTY